MKRRLGLLAAVALVLLSACGSKSGVTDRIGGDRLTIYSSLPLHGASAVGAQAVVNGELLALSQVGGRIGRYRLVFKSLDDSTATRGEWDPGQTTLNARQAILDHTTIGYLGEFNSGASAVSIPLLNRNGIPQISAANTAVGLTSPVAGASPGEPDKYYPTGIRTYARVVPNDAVQAAVQAKLQKQLGCSATFVLDDDEVDGEDMAATFAVAAQSAGLRVLGVEAFDPRATTYASLAAGVAASGADCVLLSSITESHAALVTQQLAAVMPKARFFATAGVAESSYTEPAEGGIPIALDPRVLVTVATPGPHEDPPAGRSFLQDYTAAYGPPQPYAIFGYEAMSLMLNAISRATKGGTRAALRSHVRAAIFSTRERRSVLGTYSIDAEGDTTLRRYGVYRVVAGRLAFWRMLASP